MRAFAYLSQGQAGWIEKEIPKPTGVDGVIRPLLVAPCTSDVHNVAINCLAPHRILGHEGLGEIVAVGEGVKDFQVGAVVVVPPSPPSWGPTSTAAASSPGRSSPTLRTASWRSTPSSGTWMPTPPGSPRGSPERGR